MSGCCVGYLHCYGPNPNYRICTKSIFNRRHRRSGDLGEYCLRSRGQPCAFVPFGCLIEFAPQFFLPVIKLPQRYAVFSAPFCFGLPTAVASHDNFCPISASHFVYSFVHLRSLRVYCAFLLQMSVVLRKMRVTTKNASALFAVHSSCSTPLHYLTRCGSGTGTQNLPFTNN